jgi:hypothetical protein
MIRVAPVAYQCHSGLSCLSAPRKWDAVADRDPTRAGVEPVAVPIRPGELTPIRLSDRLPREEPTVFSRHKVLLRRPIPLPGGPRQSPLEASRGLTTTAGLTTGHG